MQWLFHRETRQGIFGYLPALPIAGLYLSQDSQSKFHSLLSGPGKSSRQTRFCFHPVTRMDSCNSEEDLEAFWVYRRFAWPKSDLRCQRTQDSSHPVTMRGNEPRGRSSSTGSTPCHLIAYSKAASLHSNRRKRRLSLPSHQRMPKGAGIASILGLKQRSSALENSSLAREDYDVTVTITGSDSISFLSLSTATKTILTSLAVSGAWISRE